MSSRTMAVVLMVVMVASILVVASVLWARTTTKAGDYDRCLTTCNTLVKHYAVKRVTLKSHDGDKQCWQTCASRFGQGRDLTSAQAMKTFWRERKLTDLHPNQCAQACWRKYHEGSDIVRVAGLRSAPRSVGCTPSAVRQAARAASPRGT